MNISERKFLACQALYGLMISRPILDEEDEYKLIRQSLRIADRLIEQDKISLRNQRTAKNLLDKIHKQETKKLKREISYAKRIRSNKK